MWFWVDDIEREARSKSYFNIHFLASPLGEAGGESYTATLCINEAVPVIILQEVELPWQVCRHWETD